MTIRTHQIALGALLGAAGIGIARRTRALAPVASELRHPMLMLPMSLLEHMLCFRTLCTITISASPSSTSSIASAFTSAWH